MGKNNIPKAPTLTQKDIVTILAYANGNMKLTKAAEELHTTYKTVSSRLNYIYKRTGLNPWKFRDLVVLVDIVHDIEERENDRHTR